MPPRTSEISKYKGMIKKFRVKELQTYLEFINEDSGGKKSNMLNRAYSTLKYILQRNGCIPKEIENLIERLYE
ncbi:hypothetical protein NPIL_257021 [Nephila pilipes]|uniref:Uncharacterized protein n=1 Tax=Nephila pilipes TaxID=299642 RepID=A0A8X6NGB1_NEPPI|nr:hypothetical protein NPIL_257021 [Nephila pilipes]